MFPKALTSIQRALMSLSGFFILIVAILSVRLAAQQLICSQLSIENDQERPRRAHIIKESLRTESFTQHDFLFFTSAANYLFPVSGEMFQDFSRESFSVRFVFFNFG